jgi:cyclase
VDDIHNLLRAGADKVCINTAAVQRPKFITEGARMFGAQCIVIAVETIRQTNGEWKAFTDNGREHTGLNAYDWAMRAVELGAGELLLTSVDREGTAQGFDLEFISKVVGQVEVPVVVHGGAGTLEHVVEVAKLGVDGIVVAAALHYKKITITQIKQTLQQAGFEVRL